MSKMSKVRIEHVTPNPYQRSVNPARVVMLADKMEREGYNDSYPITVTPDFVLVDGGHRLEAAWRAGIPEVPYVVTEESPVRHSLRCNRDGADTVEDDVFDIAERVYNMQADGWTGQKIADEMDISPQLVSYYKLARERLHPRAWTIARYGSTKVGNVVDGAGNTFVDSESTNVEWLESHLRALHTQLPCPNGDRAMMRAQLRAIGDIQDRAQIGKRITAKLVENIAHKHGWYTKLARIMRDQLASEVPLRDRVQLLAYVYDGVFGTAEDQRNLDKFTDAVNAINERVLGVQLYQDDALQRIPMLDDKSVALVVADPPYNVTGHEWDRVGGDAEYLEFTRDWLAALRPKLADDYHLYIFCSPSYAARVEMLLREEGWPLKSRVIWSHRNLSMGRDASDKYITMWEMCYHVGTHALNLPTVWNDERFEVKEFASPQSNFDEGKHHPTAKPVELIKQFVRHGSKPGDVVLDPFAGGGTTGAACAELGQRRCVLIEREPEYCDVIKQRLGIGDGN